jgi:hypothetical protein
MPNLHNVVSDINDELFSNEQLNFEIQQRDEETWIVYIRVPNDNRRAKIEFIINENLNNPDDTEVIGSVLRYGPISRRTMARIMDAIVDRV